MHLDRADLAPVVLIVMILIPWLVARRRIRRLEDAERRLCAGEDAVLVDRKIVTRHPWSPTEEPRTEKQIRTDNELHEVRLDLALMRRVSVRGLWLLAVSFAFLLIMIFT